MRSRHRRGAYSPARTSSKSKWMTTILSVIFGGLLFLVIMVLMFRVGW